MTALHEHMGYLMDIWKHFMKIRKHTMSGMCEGALVAALGWIPQKLHLILLSFSYDMSLEYKQRLHTALHTRAVSIP